MSTSDTVTGAVSQDPSWLPTTLNIPQHPDLGRYPATALQAGMLYHAKANPGTGVDIEQISIDFGEELDPVQLLSSWQTVFAHHRVLGSRFGWDQDGAPFTELGHDYHIPVTYLDWRNEPLAADAAAAVMAQERTSDFDLTNGPLHRLTLARTGPAGWWLLWTFHHTILDGRSFPLVLHEILSHYDREAGPANKRGHHTPGHHKPGHRDPDLGEPGHHKPGHRDPDHGDFGRYLTAVTEKTDPGETRFWSQQLREFEAASTLTVDRDLDHDGPQPTVVGFEDRLTEAETDGLRRLADETGASLNTCVQAGWHLLLRHYTQQEIITFGATRACRHAVPDAADMVGLLINTVPLSLPVVLDETVEDLLHRLRTAQHQLRAHETTPLPAIMDAAGVTGSPLFDSIVVYDDNSLDARMQRAGLGSTPSRTRRFRYEGQTNFPLTVLAYGDRELSLRLEYATAHYDRAFADQVMTHLRAILTGLAAHRHQPAADVPYLTEAEQDQYRQWNNTEVDYPVETTLHARFEAQVAQTPNRPALLFEDETLTFDQFNRRANQLAHHLQNQGVGPDRFVGVFAERSFELMIAIYAILKAGGAYVPLDPDHPVDRLRFMAEDAHLSLILTQPHLAQRLPTGAGSAAQVEVVDLGHWRWEDQPTTNPDAGAGPDNLAYLLYTSGSTGKPKGVMLEHRSVLNRLIWMQEAFPLDHDVVLQKTPYTFDVSVWELFWPLAEGVPLALAPPGDHRDPAALVRAIRRHQVTTVHFVPSMLQLFVDEPTAGSCQSLTRVVCSGEALPRALQDRLFATLNTELHNLYGPTEAAVDVTWWACDPNSPLDTVPIGHPIANTQIHVLDRRLRPVPRGTAGELCIGGVQVARGYHNRPELTADRFVPDPFAPQESEATVYRTGDLVRHRLDGAVEFLGRLDHQVKINGQRIELGEIEATIGAHPDVKEVVVTATTTRSAGDVTLVAYVVADTTEPALRAHIEPHLATSMTPSVWMFLPAMPLSPNGKVDRGALPTPTTGHSDRPVVAPGNNTEAAVLALWQELLPDRPIGATDPFFDVGGTSILLIKLSQRLSDTFDRTVDVAALLRCTTVTAQAELLDGDAGSDPAVAAGRSRARARRNRRRGAGG